jgi:hypothetical protein
MIADTEGGVFYPMMTDEDIQDCIGLFNGNVMQAAYFCAGVIIRNLAQKSTKEVVGDVEVWMEDRKLYLDSLKDFVSNPMIVLPTGFTPYVAGISKEDMKASAADTDNPKRDSYLFTNTTECGNKIIKSGW